MMGQSRWTGVCKEGVHDRPIKVDWGYVRRGSMIGQSSFCRAC